MENSVLSKPTIRDSLITHNISVIPKPLERDEVLLLTYSLVIPEAEYEEILKELVSTQQSQVFIKRVTSLKLEDKIDVNLHIFTHIYGMTNPGAIVLLVMELFEFYITYGRVATISDVNLMLFPDGYYTKDTMVEIIDTLIKPEVVMSSFIY